MTGGFPHRITLHGVFDQLIHDKILPDERRISAKTHQRHGIIPDRVDPKTQIDPKLIQGVDPDQPASPHRLRVERLPDHAAKQACHQQLPERFGVPHF